MKGWISLHRSIKNHWLYPKVRAFTKYEAWINILMEVNHKDAKILIGNKLILCKRGQSINSLGTWQKKWNWKGRKQVRDFFILLQSDDMIVYKNISKSIQITVCNYDEYQIDVNKKETQSKRKVNVKETQSKTNNNVNNENNDNNVNKEEFDFKNLKKETWLLWSEYKKTQFKFTYKSKVSEQVAIDQLIKLSNDNDSLANKIINNSISQGYKGLFELKTNGIEQTSPKLKLL